MARSKNDYEHTKCDLSHLAKINGCYDWRNCIGETIPYSYKGEQGTIDVLVYSHGKLLCRCRDRFRLISASNLVNGNINTLVNKTGKQSHPVHKQLFQIGDKIKCGTEKSATVLLITDVYKREDGTRPELSKYPLYYECQCQFCGGKFWKRQYQFTESGCPICNQYLVIPGINDIATTAPWMVDYFQGGESEAQQYTHSSTTKITPKCPDCGKIWNKQISIANLYSSHGFKCTCADTISYPEKYITCLLDQLEYEYIRQASTYELKFECYNRHYDFYIPDKSCIVETHGRQHYERGYGHYRSAYEEQQNDLYKQELAINNGIQNYITLDCRNSRSQWIKSSVLTSELPRILHFSEEDIDWQKCASYASSNIAYDVCKYYMENDVTYIDIMHHFHIGKHAVQTYIQQGAENGWCKYIHNTSVTSCKPIDVYLNGKYVCTSPSAKLLSRESEKLFGIYLNSSRITACVNHKIESYKGFTFELVEDIKRKREVIARGDIQKCTL